MYELYRTQFIKHSINKVFLFFSKPENLEQITPPNLNFSIITPRPIEMKQGLLIDYKVRIKGIPVRWRSLISSYEPPYSFIDQQIEGPYSTWIHNHTFEEKDGGTLVTDHVKYQIPFGLFGRIAHFIFVAKDLKNIFDYREKTISSVFKNSLAKFND